MNCKAGDVAIVVREMPAAYGPVICGVSRQLIGRVVKVVSLEWGLGLPVWEFETPAPINYNGKVEPLEGWFDYCLKPLPKLPEDERIEELELET